MFAISHSGLKFPFKEVFYDSSDKRKGMFNYLFNVTNIPMFGAPRNKNSAAMRCRTKTKMMSEIVVIDIFLDRGFHFIN